MKTQCAQCGQSAHTVLAGNSQEAFLLGYICFSCGTGYDTTGEAFAQMAGRSGFAIAA